MRGLEENYNYFLKADVSEYLDEWVAIVDKSIVSHGKSAKAVYLEAVSKHPQKRPLLTRVHSNKTMIL